ncbi:MAG: SDR family NAD(P)-dependent oxidoreductase [Mycobacteriales bacterium]
MTSDPHQSHPSPRGVLVTGAARGIGRAVAQAFATAGDHVVVHYSSRFEEAEEAFTSLVGAGHALLQADITDPASASLLVDEAVRALGTVDVLVNNAAVNLPQSVATTSYRQWHDVWQQTLAVNVVGAADVSYCMARHLIDRGSGGRIVNIGSRGAFRGEPDHVAYGASKAALHAFGQSLAVALAPHDIAVASVAPGFTATPRVAERLAGAEGERLKAQSPFGRVAQPEEIAAAVLWLASPEAVWASGTILDMNGASYLRT